MITVLAVTVPTLAGRIAELVDECEGQPVRSTLYYTSLRSGVDTKTAQGAVIGVVAAFIALGLNFDAAWHIIAAHLPWDVNPAAIPEAWRDLLP